MDSDLPGPLTWQSIAQLSIVSTLVTIGVGWLRDHLTRSSTAKRDSAFLVNRVAPVLERYAFDCASLIGDNRLNVSSGGHAGTAHTSVPDLHPFPNDVDWRSLDTTLTSRALNFPNEVLQSERHSQRART